MIGPTETLEEPVFAPHRSNTPTRPGQVGPTTADLCLPASADRAPGSGADRGRVRSRRPETRRRRPHRVRRSDIGANPGQRGGVTGPAATAFPQLRSSVAGTGFEPVKALPAILQVAPPSPRGSPPIPAWSRSSPVTCTNGLATASAITRRPCPFRPVRAAWRRAERRWSEIPAAIRPAFRTDAAGNVRDGVGGAGSTSGPTGVPTLLEGRQSQMRRFESCEGSGNRLGVSVMLGAS